MQLSDRSDERQARILAGWYAEPTDDDMPRPPQLSPLDSAQARRAAALAGNHHHAISH